MFELKRADLITWIDDYPDWDYDFSTHATAKELMSEGFNLFKYKRFYLAVKSK